MKLDAFVLNPDVCDGTKLDAKVAPITQPNYTFLRIKDYVLEGDILDPVDIHNASPAGKNSRVTDLGTGELREHRLGVYLHWILPRCYRTGVADEAKEPPKPPGKNPAEVKPDFTTPKFVEPPNRWLVIRQIDKDAATTQPAGAPVDRFTAWVVESDRVQSIEKLDEDIDLQVDVSPYITSNLKYNPDDPGKIDPSSIDLAKQAETFIGYRAPAKGWEEADKDEKGDKIERVSLSVTNASNQLFPDFQHHNSNVFSMLDNFAYIEEGNEHYLTDAVADYYVFGWHSSKDDEIFTLGNKKNRGEKLSALSMVLQDTGLGDVKSWVEATTGAKTICHGAMYDVEWHRTWDRKGEKHDNMPLRRPADNFTSKLVEKMPVAIGTTPLDALLAHLKGHSETQLEQDIRTLGNLLRAQEDSVAGQQAAADESQSYNFKRIGGGSRWSIQGPGGKETAQPPTDEAKKSLTKLNDTQSMLDSTQRSIQQRQWDLFSVWWKYVTNVKNKDDSTKSDYAAATTKLKGQLGDLWSLESTLKTAIETHSAELRMANLGVEAAALPEYLQLGDPTLFVGGAASGWPEDFLKDLRVRIDGQITTYKKNKDKDKDKKAGAPRPYFIECLPPALRDTAFTLFEEFVSFSKLEPDQTTAEGDDDDDLPRYPPLYHDQGDPERLKKEPPRLGAPFRDAWNSTQPWFPLFIEWEAEYFHIDYDKWQMNEWIARLGDSKMRYGIKKDEVLYKDKQVALDRRTLSGRILLLPQPAYSLAAQISQLFSSTPDEVLEPLVPKDRRDALEAAAARMPFMSAPLGGFVDHLLTVTQGSHLKPSVRVPGTAPVPIVQAYDNKGSFEDIGIGINEVAMMGLQTDKTPYGTLVPLPAASSTGGASAFKPVVHGQFAFTKLNVIDKFGQCAPAIDQTPQAKGPPPFYPSIGDYYEPEMLPDGFANVVRRPEERDLCEFVQVPPQLGQPGRLNATFVVRNEADTGNGDYWRPTGPWDSPIWGWVLVNYVDNGLQLFLADGTFYREVRVASPNSPNPVPVSKQWLPLGYRAPNEGAVTFQMDRLIARFADKATGATYLTKFIQMATSAVDRSHSAPGAYGQFANSLVGRPLALVHAAFSLELAGPPLANQSEMQGQKYREPDRPLIGAGPGGQGYSFPLKLGAVDRLDDGLVGYFAARDPKQRAADDELDLNHIYTRHTAPDGGVYCGIDASTFPTIDAFWPDPLEALKKAQPGVTPPARHRATCNARLSANAIGALMDPFLPLHVFSGGGVAPPAVLRLPNWAWESALRRMTSFFHAGPLVVPQNVPDFDHDWRLDESYALKPGKDKKDDTYAGEGKPIPLPALQAAEWRWLQPYMDEGGKPEAFMALPLAAMDATPRLERGPYTVVEGYLQMRAPVEGKVEKKTLS